MALLAAPLATAVGCTATLGDLQGDRTATVRLASPVQECPATFELRNKSWAPILVESARVPIGTVITTEPPLPTTVKPGGTLLVTVVAKLRARAGAGAGARAASEAASQTYLLETRGAAPLALTVRAVATD